MAVAHANPALARHLRKSLETLRDRTTDDDFRRLVDDVLAGRADLRDVYFTPTFAAGINPGAEQFAERYDQLSREEQREMAEQGRQAFDELREQLQHEDQS
jgi:hypothetical protein